MKNDDESKKGRSVYLRLNQIIHPDGFLPISASTWWAGVKTGTYPRPYKLGPRITAWDSAEINAIIKRDDGNDDEEG